MRDVLELSKTAARSSSTSDPRRERHRKEILAARSTREPRADKPFVPVSCAALTETLSVGAVRLREGAFTGLGPPRGEVRGGERGRSSSTRSGTSAEAPARPLRSRERRVTRVGGPSRCPSTSGSSRDQPEPREGGRGRALPAGPLLRLNVIAVRLPASPSGARTSRSSSTTSWSTSRGDGARGRGVSSEAISLLMAHDCRGTSASCETSSSAAWSSQRRPSSKRGLGLSLTGHGPFREPASLSEIEKQHIAYVLQHAHGTLRRRADLDIDRVTLYNKIRKYHLRDVQEHEDAPEPATP